MTEPERRTVTVEEAARALGIGRSAAYAAARSGELPGVIRIGRRLLVPVAVLERMLATHTDDRTPDAAA